MSQQKIAEPYVETKKSKFTKKKIRRIEELLVFLFAFIRQGCNKKKVFNIDIFPNNAHLDFSLTLQTVDELS